MDSAPGPAAQRVALTRVQIRNLVSLAMKRARDGRSDKNLRADILQILDPVYQALAAEGETPSVPVADLAPSMTCGTCGHRGEVTGSCMLDVLDPEGEQVEGDSIKNWRNRETFGCRAWERAALADAELAVADPTPDGPPQDGREGEARRWNHYRCQLCGSITITRHDQPGTTPFMIRCRARRGCTGTAQSGFYRGSQDDGQKPHVVWFRPEGQERHRYLGKYPARQRQWVRDHLDAGGAVPRDPAAFQ